MERDDAYLSTEKFLAPNSGRHQQQREDKLSYSQSLASNFLANLSNNSKPLGNPIVVFNKV